MQHNFYTTIYIETLEAETILDYRSQAKSTITLTEFMQIVQKLYNQYNKN